MSAHRLPALLLLGVGAAVTIAASAGPFVSAHQRTPLTDVLERAAAYVNAYETRVSALVAEEAYLQEVKTGRRDVKNAPTSNSPDVSSGLLPMAGRETLPLTQQKQTGPTRRRMRSDVLMVQLPDRTWFGFRDVIDVDGKRVRDREGRLHELFLKSQARRERIADESARYNIGPIHRNTNVPTFALVYLAADMQPLFTFEKTGEEQIDGTVVWVVSFVEVSKPTVVRDDRGRDVRSSGRFWIVPSSGLVLKTELTTGDETSQARGRTTVTYQLDAALAMPVPAAMTEIYDLPGRPWDQYVECTATYSNFRRFQVTTDTKIAIPK